MSGKKDVRVGDESESGRNLTFNVPGRGEISRQEFVRLINDGKYPGYHVADINGLPTPRSNPDKSEGNNLG